jgi:hypothetical protein
MRHRKGGKIRRQADDMRQIEWAEKFGAKRMTCVNRMGQWRLSAWRRNEAWALDGAMKLERTTSQLKWSLSVTAHEAERTTVRCEDGRAGGRRNGVRDLDGGAQ